jgi:hypothetical protein
MPPLSVVTSAEIEFPIVAKEIKKYDAEEFLIKHSEEKHLDLLREQEITGSFFFKTTKEEF